MGTSICHKCARPFELAQSSFRRGLPSLSLRAPRAALPSLHVRDSLQSLLAARLGEITTSNIALYLSGEKGEWDLFRFRIMHLR